MLNVKHVKQQYGKGEEVRVGVGPPLTTYNFWRHEVRRAQYAPWRRPIYGDVVIIADKNIASIRVEKHIAEGDVTVAQTFGMELEEAISKLNSSGYQSAKARVDTTLH